MQLPVKPGGVVISLIPSSFVRKNGVGEPDGLLYRLPISLFFSLLSVYASRLVRHFHNFTGADFASLKKVGVSPLPMRSQSNRRSSRGERALYQGCCCIGFNGAVHL